MSDWRLDQVERLRGAALRFSAWKSLDPDWDHDHCLACGVKLSDRPFKDSLPEGYATTESDPHGPYYHWVCVPCFEELKAEIGWVAV
jgi:hypothetical protein